MNRLAVLMGRAELDNLIRLQILEGALGKVPRYWKGDWRKGFREVARLVSSGEATIDPSWYTNGDTTLAKACEDAAFYVAGKSADARARDMVDEIVLGFVTGISSGEMNLREKSRLYWAGEQKADMILKGKTPESFVNIIKETTRQYAVNAVVQFNRAKRQTTVSLDLPAGDGEEGKRLQPSTSMGLGSSDRQDVLEEIVLGGGSAASAVRDWMLGVADRGSPQMSEAVRTYLTMIDDHPNVTNRMVAQEMGKTEQAVGQNLKKWQDMLRTSPLPSRIQNLIEMAQDRASLGFSGMRSAKRKDLSRIAIKVASMWMTKSV